MKSFVYCEWIDEDRLTKALPSAVRIGKVVLPDYKLAFVSYHEDGSDEVRGSGCHVLPEKGTELPGLLYEFDERAKAVAEKLSRVREGRYVAQSFTVRLEDGSTVDGVAYVIKHPVGDSTPNDEYRANMIAGAKKNAFPEAYVKYIESL